MTEHLPLAQNTGISPCNTCRIWKSTCQAPCAAVTDIPPHRSSLGCNFHPVVLFCKAPMSPNHQSFQPLPCGTPHTLSPVFATCENHGLVQRHFQESKKSWSASEFQFHWSLKKKPKKKKKIKRLWEAVVKPHQARSEALPAVSMWHCSASKTQNPARYRAEQMLDHIKRQEGDIVLFWSQLWLHTRISLAKCSSFVLCSQGVTGAQQSVGCWNRSGIQYCRFEGFFM